MTALTSPPALGKAEDPDNARDYLVLVLAAALDLIAAHDHSATDSWNPVSRLAFGAIAGRPAAGNPGSVFVGTDTPDGSLSYDDGSAWHELALDPVRLSSGPVIGRGPAGNAGSVWVGTDAPKGSLSYDDGSAWHQLALDSVPFISPSGSGGQTLLMADPSTQQGLWVWSKSNGGASTIESSTAGALWLVPPGGTDAAPVSSYTSPSGESTAWYCDGTLWWCLVKA